MNKIKTRSVAYLCFLSILVVASFVACNNPFSSGSSSGSSSGGAAAAPAAPRLTITGNVGSANVGGAVSASSVGALDTIGGVQYVLLYSPGGDYEQVQVNDNGAFALPVNELQPAGIVLVGADNAYRGHVNLGNSNAMPLHAIGSDVSEIALGNLSRNDSGDDSGRIPFSVQNNLDSHMSSVPARESTALDAQGAMFSAVIENPDFDGNGVVDVLEGKGLRAGFAYYSGVLGSFNDVAVLDLGGSFNPDGFGHKFLFDINYPGQLGDVTITLPNGEAETSPHSGEGTLFFHGPGRGTADGTVEGFHGLPAPGEYQFTATPADANSIDYRFWVAESVSELIKENAIAIVPEVTLNEGKIQSISWNAYYPDMTPVQNVPRIATEIEVQIDIWKEGEDHAVRAYDSNWLPSTTTEHVLSDENVRQNVSWDFSWDSVRFIHMVYDDHFQNHYVKTYVYKSETPYSD